MKLIRSQSICALVIAFAAVGCDGGRGDEIGETPSVSELRIAGPNHLATLFVEAVKSADAGRVALLCEPMLAEFYRDVEQIGAINLGILHALERRFPDLDETERRRLWLFREGWKQPMTSFRELELDGRLRTEDDGARVVYQLAHLNRHSRTVYPELVVEKRGGRWMVVSFGPDTPGSAHLGRIRTGLARLESSWQAAVDAMEASDPRSLTRAIEILTETIGNAPAGPTSSPEQEASPSAESPGESR